MPDADPYQVGCVDKDGGVICLALRQTQIRINHNRPAWPGKDKEAEMEKITQEEALALLQGDMSKKELSELLGLSMAPPKS